MRIGSYVTHHLISASTLGLASEGLRFYKHCLGSTYVSTDLTCIVHVHCRDFNIFSSHGLLLSDLVAQSVEQR